MYNYKLTIQYNGTRYNGWQSQPDGNTIQDKITYAVSVLTKQEISLTASGRTDAGVHALGQVANFKYNKDVNKSKFLHSLNSILPDDISIINMEKVSDEFHSRFDAKKRSYFYLMSKIKSPFYFHFSNYDTRFAGLDLQKLNLISKVLLGEHDFTSFTKKKTETENKVCNISKIRWSGNNNFIIFRIEADRFLHGMVRAIVGTILLAASKDDPVNLLAEILKSKNREAAGPSALAKGLFLYKVKY